MKKKKTPTPTSTSLSNKQLPVIRIVSTEDEMFTKLNLEMEDEVYDMLVKWGKERATDDDYISVALRCGLEEYIHRTDATH
jgi:hypothetical protein